MKCSFLALCLLSSLFIQAQESADQRISRYTLAIGKHPDSAGNYINRCRAYIEKEAFTAAQADCNKALQLDPKNREALKWRGAARYLQNNLDSSILDFNEVLKANPQDAQVWRWRGNSWYWLNKLDKAIADFTEALRINAKSAITWFNRGEAYYWSGKYNEAIGDFSESIVHDATYRNAWYMRGQSYFYLGNWDLADADFTQALTLDPGNADLLAWRGRNRFRNNKDDLALADLTEALRLSPNHPFAWTYRGDLYRATEKHELAVTDYTQALLLDQKNGDALYKRGLAYYYMNKFEEAINDFNGVLKLNPQSIEALGYRGDAYADIGKYELALKDYNDVLRIQPKNVEVLASRGIVYKKTGKTDLAMKDLNEAVRIDPKSVFALTHRGDLYSLLSKYDLAVKDYNEALAIDPKNFSARNNRGNLFHSQGKHDLAVSDYSMIVLQYPRLTMAFINRGYAYRSQGKLDLALADLTQALALEPASVEALSKRGTVYMDKFQYDSALLDFNKALRIKPDDTTSLNHRGLVYKNQNKYDLAIKDFNDALRVNQKNTAVLNNLGLVYYRMGKNDLAITNYAAALKIDPDNARLMTNLILVYLASDKYEPAAALYTQYLQKKSRSYIEQQAAYSFLKNYIIACCNYLIKKEYAKALPLLQQALEEYKDLNQSRTDIPISQEYANVLMKTGWVLEHLGDKEKALEYYTSASAINPNLTNVTAKIQAVNGQIRSAAAQDDTPPEIKLLTPALVEGTTIEVKNADQVFVSGIAKDAGGIEWVKINGVNVSSLEAKGFFSSYVRAGDATLTVQAANKKGLIATAEYQLQVKSSAATTDLAIPPIPPEVKPRFHAVLIACSNYSGGEFSPLPTTIGEAKDYKKILTTYYGFDSTNIVELYDKGRDEILSHLHRKVKSLNEDDNLIILFAGHGTYKKAGDEIIGYWIPLHADAEYLYVSNLDLNNIILGSQSKHILMVSDACYSGAMRSASSDDAERTVPKSLEYEFKSRQILTSGGLTKVPGESIFIRMVIKTLELNKEKFLSAKLLYNTIFSGVRNQTTTQPELNVFGKDGNQGGQFYFIRSN